MKINKQQYQQYEDALYRILNTDRIDVAKEVAADALGEDLEDFLDEDQLDMLDLDDETLDLDFDDL